MVPSPFPSPARRDRTTSSANAPGQAEPPLRTRPLENRAIQSPLTGDAAVCDRGLVETIAAVKTGSVAGMIDLGGFHLVGSIAATVKQRILEEERVDVRAVNLALHLIAMSETWRKLVKQDKSGPT